MTSIAAALATGGSPARDEQRELTFFLGMSLLILLTITIGFGLFIMVSISSFGAPWWVHIHALTFMGWIAIYLAQNWLAFTGAMDRHRKLGRIAAFWAAWMVLVGLFLTPTTLAAHRAPPFFTPVQFLALDWVNICTFAVLVSAAIAMAFGKRSDWHRRLMLCATICVIAPAWGRILVIAGAMTPWHNVLALLCYVAIALLIDWRINRRLHASWLWGAAAIMLMGLMIDFFSTFPPLMRYADRLVGG